MILADIEFISDFEINKFSSYQIFTMFRNNLNVLNLNLSQKTFYQNESELIFNSLHSDKTALTQHYFELIDAIKLEKLELKVKKINRINTIKKTTKKTISFFGFTFKLIIIVSIFVAALSSLALLR